MSQKDQIFANPPGYPFIGEAGGMTIRTYYGF